MARLTVFASGNGSNFEAIASAVKASRHHIVRLVTDNPTAYVLRRAEKLGIPCSIVPYKGRSREESEREILKILDGDKIDLIALAGFMRLLTPLLVDAFPRGIVNIHPSLLPKYPGLHGIRDSYESGDSEMGVTIHYVDHGLDSGPIILQKSFRREGSESLEEIETKIHQVEHRYYPEVVLRLLDTCEKEKGGTP